MLNLKPTSLYIHIPFCLHRCGYCDFNTYAGKLEFRSAYVDALLNEMEWQRLYWGIELSEDPPLQTIYLGGGTPSLLTVADLAKIICGIKKVWRIDPAAEITLEMNPATYRTDYFSEIRQLGVNRLSIGLQAFDDYLLHKLDRVHTCAQFSTTLQEAQKAGFRNISVDLMLGLPEQGWQQLQHSLAHVKQWNIPHVSVYSLIIEEGTPFATLYGEEGAQRKQLPREEDERQMHHYVRSYLAEQGLYQYELSNFAKTGYFSRHNLVYWQALPYYALGAGAHCFVQQERRGSLLIIEDYIAHFAHPPLNQLNHLSRSRDFAAIAKAWPLTEVVSQEEAEKEFFLLGLRLTSGVSESDFKFRFGKEIPSQFRIHLQESAKDGLLAFQNDRWYLTSLGQDLANQVFIKFV